MKANGGYGASDFSVVYSKSNEKISTLKKRSLVNNTLTENLLSQDGYYISNFNQDCLTSLAVITMSIMVDIYFFNN
ncbi:hypothetical protein FS935_01465 [Metabacillus litoralis]|uniref:Uncharacterized protein n=1 Tax=Metabacillus litoralis TaxID=152268 RepID=A0A5C6W8X2_9BACI|nr:hypothetical protein [Metabacillus litoralis]TXC92888.1 hypothetical protein FS935_01465 [Metabacillus litoralis]